MKDNKEYFCTKLSFKIESKNTNEKKLFIKFDYKEDDKTYEMTFSDKQTGDSYEITNVSDLEYAAADHKSCYEFKYTDEEKKEQKKIVYFNKDEGKEVINYLKGMLLKEEKLINNSQIGGQNKGSNLNDANGIGNNVENNV